MTASIEQERASLSAFIEMAEREGFDTAHQWYDAKGWVFFSPPTADCWRYWQAARRAPAVPVPQGWKLVPVEPTENMYMCVGYYKDDPAIAKRVIRRDYQAMLAAAPQPPEADMGIPISQTNQQVEAPVQLPEIDAGWFKYDKVSRCWHPQYSEYAETHAKPQGWQKLYTEQQVRDLLAAHGIEVAP